MRAGRESDLYQRPRAFISLSLKLYSVAFRQVVILEYAIMVWTRWWEYADVGCVLRENKERRFGQKTLPKLFIYLAETIVLYCKKSGC